MSDTRSGWARSRALGVMGALDPAQQKIATAALQAKEDRMRAKAIREAEAWIAAVKARRTK